MARRFTRKRWRRPQRLTLEGPPPARRKDIVVPQTVTLERDLIWHDNRRKTGVLLGGFLLLATLEGLAIGMLVGVPWLAIGLLALAIGHLAAGAKLGDGWIQAALGAAECDDPQALNLLRRVADDASVPAPQLVVVSGAAPNCVSLGLRRRWVAVTSGALRLPLLEQEALLARAVIHLRDTDSVLASVYILVAGAPELSRKCLRAPAGPLALLSLAVWPACLVLRALGSPFFPADVHLRADISGCLVTRYPPGMSKVLTAMAVEQSDSRLGITDRFWAAPRADIRGPTVPERAGLIDEM